MTKRFKEDCTDNTSATESSRTMQNCVSSKNQLSPLTAFPYKIKGVFTYKHTLFHTNTRSLTQTTGMSKGNAKTAVTLHSHSPIITRPGILNVALRKFHANAWQPTTWSWEEHLHDHRMYHELWHKPHKVPPGPWQAEEQAVVLSTHNQSQDPIYTVGYGGKDPQSQWVKGPGLKTLHLPCETKLGEKTYTNIHTH